MPIGLLRGNYLAEHIETMLKPRVKCGFPRNGRMKKQAKYI